MKLRNKKTGETRVFYYLHPTLPNGSVLLGLLDDDGESQTYTYGSLADFNEEWEDLDAAITRNKNRIEFLERTLKSEKALLEELCGEEGE